MFLTRIFLNVRSRAAREAKANPEALHKFAMRLFPDGLGSGARSQLAVLHRLDESRDKLMLLIQSRLEPSVERVPEGSIARVSDDPELALAGITENPTVRALGDERAKLVVGQRLLFRLRANTTKKVDTKSGPDGARRNGRRIPVRGDDERLAWLSRHAVEAGFRFNPAATRVVEVGARGGRGERPRTFAGAQFEGVLEVTDVAKFRAALEEGIGPAKAFGFGLLSIRPLEP